jgi:hypothetical protein
MQICTLKRFIRRLYYSESLLILWDESRFTTKQKECGVCFSSKIPVKVPFTKANFVSYSASYSLWIIYVIYGDKCVNIFAFGGYNTDIHFGWANNTKYLLGNVSSQAQFCQVLHNFVLVFIVMSYRLECSKLRSALFWIITQWVIEISYRRFGTTCRSQLRGLTLEAGTEGLSRNASKKLPLLPA